MARSVAFYLPRFDEEPPAPAPEPEFVAPALEPELVAIEETAPPPIVLTDELREQLIEEGRAAARSEFEEQIASERAGYAEHLDNERRRWTSEEGERLGERFHTALEELTIGLRDDLALVLEPFVVREIRDQMLASLMERLRAALADRDEAVIHLSGPMDLLEVVCSKLSSHDVTTSIVDVGGIDVKARIDSTTIETRLGEWLARLRGEDEAA